MKFQDRRGLRGTVKEPSEQPHNDAGPSRFGCIPTRVCPELEGGEWPRNEGEPVQ